MLAVQNMSACGVVSQSHEVEFNALEGSLNMMSKVLNDVLDLYVGRDESSPFANRVLQSSHGQRKIREF